MSTPRTVKRRRLSDSSRTLSKPFVSPLRTTNTQRTPLRQNDHAVNTPYQPSVHAHTIKAIRRPSPRSKVAVSIPAKSTPIRKSIILSTTSKQINPKEKEAQRALTSLDFQIRTVRNEIDTLSQATRILTSTTDADLEDLAQKWKLASQTAGEELFGTVKERVCRMGGVGAWRESENRKFDRANGLGEFAEKEVAKDDDTDCEFDSQGEELPDEEQEARRAEKRRVLKEMREAADVEEESYEGREDEKKRGKVWMEEGEGDDAFTMDMMLRSLNIELDVIGYDKVGQRWSA